MTTPTVRFDGRFSDPAATALDWSETEVLLTAAELYWITTVRPDGRPHITPAVGVFHDGAVHFTTGPTEQKHRNLDHSRAVAVTTGNNAWAAGTDVVVEGSAETVTDDSALRAIAAAYLEKYGDDWAFEVGDGGFGSGDGFAHVFRVRATKAFAFAKNPHGQTAYDFD